MNVKSKYDMEVNMPSRATSICVAVMVCLSA